MVASWTLGHLADIIPSPAWFDSGLCGLCRKWGGESRDFPVNAFFTFLLDSKYSSLQCLPVSHRIQLLPSAVKQVSPRSAQLQTRNNFRAEAGFVPLLKTCFLCWSLTAPYLTSQFPWWLVCTDVIYLLWRKNLPWSLLTSWWRFPFRKKGVNPPLPFVSSLLYQIKAGNSKLPFQLLSSNLGRKLDFYSWLLSHAPHGSLALSWKHLIFPTIPWLLLWLFWDFSWDLF